MTLGVVFDMDDTLYLERDYVKSGFQAVAAVVAGAKVSEEDAFALLWGHFEAGTRGTTFNELLARYPELGESFAISDLVSVYREHAPTIDLLPAMKALLLELRAKDVPLGVITDGPYVSQRAKADALNVERYADCVILTDTWGKEFWKPHPKAFEEASKVLKVSPENLIYIGDNPSKDFHAPAQLGWQSVRLRLREQLRFDHDYGEYRPTQEATSVAELREFLLSQLP